MIRSEHDTVLVYRATTPFLAQPPQIPHGLPSLAVHCRPFFVLP